jgi:hypothetical protein
MAEAGEKLKVFISYSRKDSAAFVDERPGRSPPEKNIGCTS